MDPQKVERDGQRDFDFLIGDWNVRNQRLRHPLSQSDEWYEFDSSVSTRPLWNGKGNVEEYVGTSPIATLEGFALRLYDPLRACWSIYWGTAQHGLTVVPNVGSFNSEGVGDFYSDELFTGTPIVCRYRWTQKYGNGCRWEQAFSTDNGGTWETNWIMDFTRQ